MPPNDWTLWQLADSAFPSGGFTHSGGVEAAYRLQLIRDETDLLSFLRASLNQFARQSLPAVDAMLNDPDEFTRVDQWLDVMLTNHVANRASRSQGRALLAAASHAFTQLKLSINNSTPSDIPHPPSAIDHPCHLAAVWGLLAAQLRFDPDTAKHLLLFVTLRGQLSAAVRLGIIGPLRSQSLLESLDLDARALIHRLADCSLNDIAATSPLLDCAQAHHDRLYSRLFQS